MPKITHTTPIKSFKYSKFFTAENEFKWVYNKKVRA